MLKSHGSILQRGASGACICESFSLGAIKEALQAIGIAFRTSRSIRSRRCCNGGFVSSYIILREKREVDKLKAPTEWSHNLRKDSSYQRTRGPACSRLEEKVRKKEVQTLKTPRNKVGEKSPGNHSHLYSSDIIYCICSGFSEQTSTCHCSWVVDVAVGVVVLVDVLVVVVAVAAAVVLASPKTEKKPLHCDARNGVFMRYSMACCDLGDKHSRFCWALFELSENFTVPSVAWQRTDQRSAKADWSVA